VTAKYGSIKRIGSSSSMKKRGDDVGVA